MKYIQLTQGQQTSVDDDLYYHLNQWKWYYRKRSGNRASGDVVRTLHGINSRGIQFTQTLYMTSLICPVPKGYLVDHIDRDPTNNQRHNLRTATPSINVMNAGARINNKLKEKNIHWAHAKQRYIVQVRVDGKRVWKAFTELEDAKRFRDGLI
jgi:hypothetical protein